MNPTSAQRETIRLSALRHLEAQRAGARFGLGTALLLQLIRNEGFRELTAPDLEAELQYLADKGLTEQAMKLVSPENRNWRITATGRDHYAQLSNE